MKKTYWWRWVTSFIFGIIIIFIWGYYNFLCFTNGNNICLFHKIRGTVLQPLFLYSLFLFITSLALFFVRDKVFLLWMKLAIIWSIITGILVSLVPVSQGGWLGIGPEKWSVTMAMGWGFFVISIALLVWKSLSKKH